MSENNNEKNNILEDKPNPDVEPKKNDETKSEKQIKGDDKTILDCALLAFVPIFGIAFLIWGINFAFNKMAENEDGTIAYFKSLSYDVISTRHGDIDNRIKVDLEDLENVSLNLYTEFKGSLSNENTYMEREELNKYVEKVLREIAPTISKNYNANDATISVSLDLKTEVANAVNERFKKDNKNVELTYIKGYLSQSNATNNRDIIYKKESKLKDNSMIKVSFGLSTRQASTKEVNTHKNDVKKYVESTFENILKEVSLNYTIEDVTKNFAKDFKIDIAQTMNRFFESENIDLEVYSINGDIIEYEKMEEEEHIELK